MNVAGALIQSSLLGEAIDHGPAAMFVADETMRYVAVNERACDLLGYTRDELLKLSVTDVSPWPDSTKQFADVVANRSTTGSARLVRKDRSELDVDYRAGETTVAGMTLYVSLVWPSS